jgi:glycerol-3-phosphate dehydrogenase (NAD(P)+)
VGEEIARGRTIEEIMADMKMVAEGVKSARTVMELATEYGVQTPIAAEVDAVVSEGRTASEAFRGLRRAPALSESHAA